MSIVLVTPPAVEPVSLADLKLQIGLSPNEDTDHVRSQMLARQLRRYIKTARVDCENRTRRVFITQTWKLLRDSWPSVNSEYEGRWYPMILLPKPPFQSVVSFTYTSTDGTTQDMAEYGYQTDPGSETQPGRLFPPFAMPFPPIRLVPNNVQITFECGYGATGDAVPETITQAILFLAHSYYDPSAYKNVDGLVDNLLGPYINRVS